MTSHLTLRAITLAVLTLAATTSAMAQDSSSYYYLGLGAGQSRAKFDEAQITSKVVGNGLAITGIQSDMRDTAYKVFLGYQINNMVGLEAGYFNLGKFKFDASTTPAGNLHGDMRVQGAALDLVGTLPVSENFAVFARAGVTYAKTRDNFSGSGAVVVSNPTPSKREANAKLGLGLQYAFSTSMMLRTEIERYRISDAVDGKSNVNVVSASLVFPFGRAPTARRASATPSYVAPMAQAMPAAAPAPMPMMAAAPAPMVVAPAPVAMPPERRRVSFSADSLFSFDNAAVHPDGKLALDKFAQALKGTQYDTISVEGHTDRLGTEAYNQALSQKRADTVKAYLVASDGLDAGKINASGKSESAPVTKPGDCKGNAANAKLIACLQPDRRVEVEVVGTR